MQWLRIRLFWSPFKRLHPEYNTPHFSILSQMILACLFVSLGTFDQLFSYVVFVMLLSSIATGIGPFYTAAAKTRVSKILSYLGISGRPPSIYLFLYLDCCSNHLCQTVDLNRRSYHHSFWIAFLCLV